MSAVRRLSVTVAPTAAVVRAPCSPITNDHPHVHTATKPPTSRVPVLKKIRSFTSLLSRSSSPAPRPATPTGPTKKELARREKEARRAEKKKKQEDYATMYGNVFASEVALLQLLDGGTTSRNIERVHKAHAKARGHPGAVASGVVRGPGGELFADAQEESERRGLVRGGYERSRTKRVQHREEEAEVFYDAEEEPAWAKFQPRGRSNTAHAQGARDAFFADSFAPAVPVPARRA